MKRKDEIAGQWQVNQKQTGWERSPATEGRPTLNTMGKGTSEVKLPPSTKLVTSQYQSSVTYTS